MKQKGEDLACIAGIPEKGETIGGETFDGETEAAIFPGRPAGQSRGSAARRSRRRVEVREIPPAFAAGRELPAYPPRPRARISDGRPPCMSDHRRAAGFPHRPGTAAPTRYAASRAPSRAARSNSTPEHGRPAMSSSCRPRRLPPPRSLRWGSLLISRSSASFVIWAGLSIVQLIEDLFARSQYLGWIGLGLAGLAGLAALAIILPRNLGPLAPQPHRAYPGRCRARPQSR